MAMLELEIDGKQVQVPEGSTVMDAARQIGTFIPHFCYHKKLSIAASCRMCLVQVEKAPKPMPACATPVTNGMKVMTRSELAVKALDRLSYFYHEESCGQCTPCREGTGWLYRVVHRIEHGLGRPEDLDLLTSVADNICGRTICALGDAAAFPVKSFVKHFRSEFEYHIEHKKCLVPPDVQRAGSDFFVAAK